MTSFPSKSLQKMSIGWMTLSGCHCIFRIKGSVFSIVLYEGINSISEQGIWLSSESIGRSLLLVVEAWVLEVFLLGTLIKEVLLIGVETIGVRLVVSMLDGVDVFVEFWVGVRLSEEGWVLFSVLFCMVVSIWVKVEFMSCDKSWGICPFSSQAKNIIKNSVQKNICCINFIQLFYKDWFRKVITLRKKEDAI